MTFGETRFRNAAREALRFLLFQMRSEARLLHTFRKGAAKQPGFLDDYSYLVNACLDLYEVEFDELPIDDSPSRLADEMLHLFSDPADGPLFYTASDVPQSIAQDERPTSLKYPCSGNSAAACGLLRLAQLSRLGAPVRPARGEQIIAATTTLIERAPLAVGQMLVAACNQVNQQDTLVVVCPNAATRESIARQLHRYWLPQATLVLRTADGEQQPVAAWSLDHLFAGRDCIDDQPTLYHCSGTTRPRADQWTGADSRNRSRI
jgi:uncharacterized protein YyaL (SSP411 family)